MPEEAPAVKIAVRVVPVPVMAPRVPRVTSAAVNPVGASLKVKIMVAVAPAFKSAADDVMVTVGAMVSMMMTGVRPAAPLLPAASV